MLESESAQRNKMICLLPQLLGMSVCSTDEDRDALDTVHLPSLHTGHQIFGRPRIAPFVEHDPHRPLAGSEESFAVF